MKEYAKEWAKLYFTKIVRITGSIESVSNNLKDTWDFLVDLLSYDSFI